MGTLYVVATPIGNLEDISRRAARILGEVALVAAEDTRIARVLLRHLRATPRLLSYNEHNRDSRIPEILAALDSGDVALVTDAGTPAISDPGVELVAAARAAGFAVAAVPGPSAVATALSVAGLAAREWTFVGFMPRTDGDLRRLLQKTPSEQTLVAFESPQRLRKTLAVMAEELGSRRVAICRELTKMHEEVFIGTATDALAHFEAPRGEIAIVIEGQQATTRPLPADNNQAAAAKEVELMKDLGLTRAQAAALLASRYGLSRREAYALWLGK
jgi:16S rRNA (cytidine1402-2'-O)-methyltransferase